MTASKMAFLAVIAVGLVGSAAPGTADEDIPSNLNFVVKAVKDLDGECRTVIDGKYGGAIRAKGGKKVRWTGPQAFTIKVTEFDDNDSAAEPLPAKAFDEPIPPKITGEFVGTLVRPDKGASTLFFKYTIELDGCQPADPPIIIERR